MRMCLREMCLRSILTVPAERKALPDKDFFGGGSMEPKRKKGKKKYIFLIVLLLLAGAAAGLCICFYPRWRAAGNLKDGLASARFTYELEIALDKRTLETQQAEMMENLSKLAGFGKDALFRFSVKGSVWEDRIYALFYPEGATDPLIELYLSSDLCAVNETLPYNTIRKNLTAQHGLLDYIMPAERDAVYMTLEQAEELFGLDLGGLRDFALPMRGSRLSRLDCFLMLVAMSEENGIYSAGTSEADDGSASLKLMPSGVGADSVTLRFDMREPDEVLAGNEKLLSLLEDESSVRQLMQQMTLLKSISGTVALGRGEEIHLPDKLIDQEKFDVLIGIRDLIRKAVALFTPSSS